jgi:hypothetical protein
MADSLKSLGRAAVAALGFVSFFPITAIAVAAESQKPRSLLVPSVPSPIAQSNNYIVNVRADSDMQWQPVDVYWTRVMVANVTTGAAIT